MNRTRRHEKRKTSEPIQCTPSIAARLLHLPSAGSDRYCGNRKNDELAHTINSRIKCVCRPCLTESADGEYSDAHLSEVRLPMRPRRTTSNALPMSNFRCNTPPFQLPLSGHPGSPNLSTRHSPATCRIPSARGSSSAAQRCPVCPALAYLAQIPAGASRRPQRPLLVSMGAVRWRRCPRCRGLWLSYQEPPGTCLC